MVIFVVMTGFVAMSRVSARLADAEQDILSFAASREMIGERSAVRCPRRKPHATAKSGRDPARHSDHRHAVGVRRSCFLPTSLMTM